MAVPPQVRLATANTPGAVAVIELYHAPDALLAELSALPGPWLVGRLRYADLAEIDDGLVGRVSESLTHIYLHGGPRVVQKLMAWCLDHGAEPIIEVNPLAAYPEAETELEARVLATLARAASPAAVDVLLGDPTCWPALAPLLGDADGGWPVHAALPEDLAPLRHLITPPMVVVAGAPNAGKSTLLNRLVGRSAAAVSDTPGTTRDYVAQLVELPSPLGGVTVRWLDTPGLRSSDDMVEQQAIGIAAKVIEDADVLLALREPSGDWPVLLREPDLRVVSKIDQQAVELVHGELGVSADTGQGIGELLGAVISCLRLHA